jgi:hypothetical protein
MPGDWWRVPLVAAAIATGVGLSIAHGPPAEMPGVSLGWPWLLHLERGVALLAVAAAALLVGVRGTRGRFPSRFGQLEYDAGGLAAEDLETRLRALEEERVLANGAEATPSRYGGS